MNSNCRCPNPELHKKLAAMSGEYKIDPKKCYRPGNVYDAVRDGHYDSKLEWKDDKRAYHLDQARLQDIFKHDLFEEYGVEGNPKAERCYAMAWEHGHSSGLSEVSIYFAELVTLIKD